MLQQNKNVSQLHLRLLDWNSISLQTVSKNSQRFPQRLDKPGKPFTLFVHGSEEKSQLSLKRLEEVNLTILPFSLSADFSTERCSHDFSWLLEFFNKLHFFGKFHWNSSSHSEDFLLQFSRPAITCTKLTLKTLE